MKSKLSEEQKEVLKKCIDKRPTDYGFIIDFWTGEILSELVKSIFHIELSSRTCERLLMEFDYSREKIGKISKEAADKSYSLLIDQLLSNDDLEVWIIDYIHIVKEPVMKNSKTGEIMMYKNRCAVLAFNVNSEEVKGDIINQNKKIVYEFYSSLVMNSNNEKKKILLMYDSPLNKSIISMMNEDPGIRGKCEVRFIYTKDGKLNPLLQIKEVIKDYRLSSVNISQRKRLGNKDRDNIEKIIKSLKNGFVV